MNKNKTKNYKNKKNKILFSLLTVIFIILFLSVIFKCKNSPGNSNSFQNGHHYYIEERQKTQNNALAENPGNEVSGKKSDDFNKNEHEQKSFLEQSEQREKENELSEIEKQKEIERTAESSKTDDSINNVAFLSSETRKTVFREETDNKPEISYITCFTEDGIICKKTGMGENEYLWKMDYRDEQDYEKVMDLLHSFPEDWDLRFSSNEKFWKDYLAERVDKDDLVSNINEYLDKGKMNFFIERDGNTYINPAAAKYANYMNSPEARIYNAEEFTEIIANELRENQRKLVDPDNADALKFIDERIEDFKRHMLGENYNKVNHKNYYSNNYTWQADNSEGLFRIYGRDGELLSTIGYADLLNIDEDVLISEYGFNDELFRTLSYVREE